MDCFGYDGMMDVNVSDFVARDRSLYNPDVLFTSLKALDGT
jgi:hypothetical protein